MDEKARTLLLVEDDRALLRSLKVALEREGWQVTAAPSVEDAFRELKNRTFDLIVTDYIFFTDKDGLHLLSYLNQTPGSPPTILMSGSRNHGLDLKARERGAYAFLPKPFDLRVFLETCQGALRGESPQPPPVRTGCGQAPRG